MLISFIVPVYNTELYLEECLDSLLKQNISHNEYEIICVNDGSTDGSSEILHKYASQYNNIIIVDKDNGGVSSARNVGIDVAKGRYIWFFDSDDLLRYNSLLEVKNHIEENNPDRIRVGLFVYEGDCKPYFENSELKSNSNASDSYVTTCIISRQFINEHNCRFNTDLAYSEDGMFVYDLNSHSHYCTVIDKPLYFYRMREDSAMNSYNEASNEKRIKSYFICAKKMKINYECGIGNAVESANLLMSFIWFILYFCVKLPKTKRKSVIKEMKKNGLFPYKRPAECTLIKSYQTTRTDIIGEIFDWIYIHSHTRFGYILMLLWEKIYSFYTRRIKNG